MAVFTCDACGEKKQRTREVPFAVKFEAGEKTRFLNVAKRKGIVGEHRQLEMMAENIESGDGDLALSCCRKCRDTIAEVVDVGQVQMVVPRSYR